MLQAAKIASTLDEVARLTPMFTKADLVRVLHVSRRTITRLVANKQLPAPVMVGKRARWCSADIEHFILTNRAW